MGLSEVKNLMYSCRECGNCGGGPLKPFREGDIIPEENGQLKCLPYEKFRFVAYRPSGRVWLISRFNDGAIELTEDLVKIAYTDTTCGICDEICAPEFVPLFRGLREEILEKRPELIPAEILKTNGNIGRYNNPFGLEVKDRATWVQRMGLPEKGETIYFAGCYASYKYPEIAQATVKLMRAAGSDVAYLGKKEICCGNQAYWSGNTNLALAKAKALTKLFEEAGAKEVVFSCAEGYENFKSEYPKYLGEMPFQVFHITEWLHRKMHEGRLRFTKSINVRVTYHDPCRLGRFCRIFEPPRKLITSVPGISLIERTKNPQWENCCGSGGGIVNAAYHDFSFWAGQKRILELKESSNYIVTSCPMCIDQLNEAVAETDGIVKVGDITSLLAEAL